MLSVEELRADIIRSAARGQGPTFIAAKLDLLIGKAREATPGGGAPGGLRYCNCADPENCREPIPGYACRPSPAASAVHGEPSRREGWLRKQFAQASADVCPNCHGSGLAAQKEQRPFLVERTAFEGRLVAILTEALLELRAEMGQSIQHGWIAQTTTIEDWEARIGAALAAAMRVDKS